MPSFVDKLFNTAKIWLELPETKAPHGDAEKATRPDPGKLPVSGPIFDQPVETEVKWGENTDLMSRTGSNYTFKQLRALADNCDLIRIAIQMRKEQIRGLRWDIVVKPEYQESEKDLEARRQKVRSFFKSPDSENDYNFNDFISAWLEDLLVLDASACWIRKDRAGRLLDLVHIDGATIKPVLDKQGFLPKPPATAYAQIIQGQVTTEFSRDEIWYSQYNPRSSSPYGMSPVEMCITAAHISLKRQLHNLTFYTEGTVPDYLLIAPPEWTPSQIVEVQRYLDAYLSGSSAKRHKMKLVPSGIKPEAMKQNDFTTTIDEWLARIIASVFNVAPHILLKQRTKQQASVIEDQQADLGLDPLKAYMAEAFTERIIAELFQEDRLAFVWLSDKTVTEEQNLNRAKAMIPLGAVGIDEMRRSEGKPELGVPPYILLPNSIIFLTEKVRQKIANGELEFVNADGGGGALREPSAVNPKPAPSKPAGGTPAAKKMEVTEDALKILWRDEVDKWERFMISDLRKGREPRVFQFRFLPDEISARMRFFSESKSVVPEAAVKACIDEAKKLIDSYEVGDAL